MTCKFRTIVFIIALTIFCRSFGFAQKGIQFISEPWDEILAVSKATNKLIFIDAFTTWCGPCKWMSKNTFLNDTVAEFYNHNFICVKIDMEKDHGLRLAKKFKIRFYPTYLFLDAQESLVDRASGAKNANDFIVVGKTALEPKISLAELKKRYHAEPTVHEFFITYILALAKSGLPTNDVLISYYSQEKELIPSTENLELILEYIDEPSAAAFDFIIKNKPLFADSSQEKLNRKLVSLGRQIYTRSVADDSTINEEIFKESILRIQNLNYERSDFLISEAHIYKPYIEKDWHIAVNNTEKHINRFLLSDHKGLLMYGYLFYELIDKPEQLEVVLEWSTRALQLEKTYEAYRLQALILLKLNRYNESKTSCNKAIKLAKSKGIDHSSVQKTLEKIKMIKFLDK